MIRKYQRPTVIAEIGCNHMGNFDIAKQMISVAKYFADVHIVKFQKRNPKELLTKKEYNSPHPNPDASYGKTYGEHRQFLEFNIDQHKALKEYCEEVGVEYSSSVWDLTSAKELVSINPKMIKIPSACNLNFVMMNYLCDNYGGFIHLSLGMTSKAEEEKIVNFYQRKKRNKDLILYSCTSGYPVPFDEISLLEIDRLRKRYSGVVKDIGFSGHHLGISIDIAAYTLGANYVERHFTLDRTWKGTDHAASLEPDGLRRVVRDLAATFKSLTFKSKDILDIEKTQRKKLKKIKELKKSEHKK